MSETTQRRFFVADLNARGDLLSKAEYQYSHLEQIPGAADLIASFSGQVWRSPEEFEMRLPSVAAKTEFRWRASAATAGIATLKCDGQLASLSLLVSGMQTDADQITLQAFQQHLLRELHDTGHEPAFSLMEQLERPLVATINFQGPTASTDQLIVALADRCFAASYFRYHGLA